MKRVDVSGRMAATASVLAVALLTSAFVVVRQPPQGPDWSGAAQVAHGATMIILRGVASGDAPRGQLDDASALEYARQLGYSGEVLDVAGKPGTDSPQVRMALDRIRRDQDVTAIYGFSGGGYNARSIWRELSPHERRRIGRIVIVGSPGVDTGDFPGGAEVVVRPDPPEGHMAGPKVLLEELNHTVGGRS